MYDDAKITLKKLFDKSVEATHSFIKENIEDCYDGECEPGEAFDIVKDMIESTVCTHRLLEILDGVTMANMICPPAVMSNITPIHEEKTKGYESHFDEALKNQNYKWLYYLLLKDEIKDIKRYLMVHSKLVSFGMSDVATKIKSIVIRRNDIAVAMNELYNSVSYTHGTVEEHILWDNEYNALMKEYKSTISKVI